MLSLNDTMETALNQMKEMNAGMFQASFSTADGKPFGALVLLHGENTADLLESLNVKSENAAAIAWQPIESASSLLIDELDESGAADGCIVKLDTLHPEHDNGPYLRQAWYCSANQAFICSATGTALPNVKSWAFDLSDMEGI